MAKYDNEYEDTMSGGAEALDEYFEPTVERAGRKIVSAHFEDEEEDEEDDFEDSQSKYDEAFESYEEMYDWWLIWKIANAK